METKARRIEGQITLDGRVRFTGEHPARGLVIVFDFLSPEHEVVTSQKTQVADDVVRAGREASYQTVLVDPVRAVSYEVRALRRWRARFTRRQSGALSHRIGRSMRHATWLIVLAATGSAQWRPLWRRAARRHTVLSCARHAGSPQRRAGARGNASLAWSDRLAVRCARLGGHAPGARAIHPPSQLHLRRELVRDHRRHRIARASCQRVGGGISKTTTTLRTDVAACAGTTRNRMARHERSGMRGGARARTRGVGSATTTRPATGPAGSPIEAARLWQVCVRSMRFSQPCDAFHSSSHHGLMPFRMGPDLHHIDVCRRRAAG